KQPTFQVLLAQPGTQHSSQLAHQLDKHSALQAFYTGLTLQSNGAAAGVIERVAPGAWRKLANRSLPPFTHAKLHRRVRLELDALWKLRRGLEEQSVLHRRNELFQHSISNDALRVADFVVGVDT